MPTADELWALLPWSYLLTIALETPVLLLCLSQRHSWARRLFAGVWLTACTYPIVFIVMPLTIWPSWGYTAYLVIAETFAPLAECALLLLAYPLEEGNSKQQIVQDCLAIVAANLASFLVGGYLMEQLH